MKRFTVVDHAEGTMKRLIASLLIFGAIACPDVGFTDREVSSLSYEQATLELHQKGSVPLIDTMNVSQGKGHIAEFRIKIFDGEDADIHTYPWQVAIVLKAERSNLAGHVCGGSLIRPDWVVTAAHCVNRGTSPQQINILVGTDHLQKGGQRIGVSKIIVKENFDRNTYENDIALLKLATPVTISAITSPINLITLEQEARFLTPGVTAIITGWGFTKKNGSKSPQLKKGGVPIVSRVDCNTPDSYDGEITDNMFCAGHREGKTDACTGDSGGPLMVAGADGGYLLAGIVSWGKGCAENKKYGVYTRVSNYSAWVATKVQL